MIRGGKPLAGRIPISGAKNAALTLMPCALLTDEPLTLRNLPRLADVDGFGHLLNELGVSTSVEGSRKARSAGDAFRAGNTPRRSALRYRRKMRASILVLGPCLRRGRERRCRCPGDARRHRPIDLHLKPCRRSAQR